MYIYKKYICIQIINNADTGKEKKGKRGVGVGVGGGGGAQLQELSWLSLKHFPPEDGVCTAQFPVFQVFKESKYPGTHTWRCADPLQPESLSLSQYDYYSHQSNERLSKDRTVFPYQFEKKEREK